VLDQGRAVVGVQQSHLAKNTAYHTITPGVALPSIFAQQQS